AWSKTLANNLILDFSNEESFAANFFRLIYAIYERPTFYSIKYSARNDPKEGYLVTMFVDCEPEYLKLIDSVEYRFDYEFDYTGYNNKIIDGAVHLEENRRSRFAIRDLWTSESITVFAAVYLRTTKVVYLRFTVEVGTAVN